jgi:hypothetical protein
MLIGVCRIGGFGFDFKNADITFVHVSGRQLIAIDWLLTFEFKRSGIRECWRNWMLKNRYTGAMK